MGVLEYDGKFGSSRASSTHVLVRHLSYHFISRARWRLFRRDDQIFSGMVAMEVRPIWMRPTHGWSFALQGNLRCSRGLLARICSCAHDEAMSRRFSRAEDVVTFFGLIHRRGRPRPPGRAIEYDNEQQ